MKKLFAILTMCCITGVMTSHATVWTVNNIHGVAHFSTLQDAINGASAGDTLYIEGSPHNYGDGIFDKKLTVIGPGYWLEENDSTQAYKEVAQVGHLTFDSGSEGSLVEGIYIYEETSGLGWAFKLITINADSITIQRNYLFGFANDDRTYDSQIIFISGNRQSIVIRQNWIMARVHDWYSGNNGVISGIYFDGIPSESAIYNNFIRSIKTSSHGEQFAIYINSNDPSNNVDIVNNVIWGNITTYYSGHFNNILLEGTYNLGIGDICLNNLCNGIQYPDINNNQQNVDMSTVFVDFDLYIDNGYILTPGSSAIDAGVNGGDCGVFGYYTTGAPYKLSGLPGIPAIFEATISTIGSTTIPGNIKAKSHN